MFSFIYLCELVDSVQKHIKFVNSQVLCVCQFVSNSFLTDQMESEFKWNKSVHIDISRFFL